MTLASNSSSSARLTSNTGAVVQPAPQPFYRVRLLITIASGVVALVAFGVFLVTALQWRGHAFFGVMMNPYMVVDGSRPITDTTWPGLSAGIQRLDRIISVNGQALSESPTDHNTARANFLQITSGLKAGETVTVIVNRPDSSPAGIGECAPAPAGGRDCQFSYAVEALPDNDFITYFVIPFAIGLIAVIVGLGVLYLRANQHPARMTALFCLAIGLFMGGLFDLNNTYALVPLWMFGTLFLGAPVATLAMVFPVRAVYLYRRPYLHALPFVVNGIAVVAILAIYFNPPNPYIFTELWQLGIFWGLLALVWLFITALQHRRSASSPAIRDQSNAILIGIALIVAPVILWVLNSLIQQMNVPSPIYLNTSALMPFFIMPPLSLAYAVLQYRRVDTDRIISQGITYGVILVAVILGYFLLVYGASLIARDALRLEANNPFIIALAIFFVALIFLPLRTAVQRRVDQIYFLKRTNYQEQVETFARNLTHSPQFDQIVTAFRQQLDSAISPSNVFIYLPDKQSGSYRAYGETKPDSDLRFDADSGIVTLLMGLKDENYVYLKPGMPWPSPLWAEQARLKILKTMVIAQLQGRQELVGFVCIGPPRSEAGVYQYEELRFIQNITSQMALAVERAQAVETLEKRVRELDILSQVSQAINFTVEFDDLLELLYAQTDRLISAPYFYIALRERVTEKLFFAFFVEDEERYSDKENQRWLMGRDLFSQIVQESVPLRVENYVEEMTRLNSPILLESRDLKAWMGVPLIAGQETLGVVAVGSTEAGKVYTDDQLKIFSDIGALAATSLDKARLFAETNLRSRQLRVLNEISQKLASELNVQNLLELITKSAVEILNGEAGSLLLSVEDGSANALEFKVAVGGSGQDLVGKRFPKDKGLAGEVASTGKPVIVNNTATDARWGGEVASGKFSTNAVLAVPLVAQNRVIGVLEVLNKKDGSVFVREDTELLTTFAGQAAVALENARLFEMTDLQLGQRVAELQALERIDVELNRSLDLKKVADITMRWAIANSGATAGVLGLVVGEPPQLQIISKYGYEDDDFPAGAEGTIWPLDRGIVSRVMRTRQPDLVNDVSIDRDYIPSLRSAQSQLTIPMLSGGAINAILLLEKDRQPRLGLVEMSFAQRLAEHASIAITNAQLYAELTRANESKSEFVSFVAHELKTPMTSIKGFTDLLLSGVAGKPSEQQGSFLGTIRSNIDRMNTLVSDLNDVTKLQTNNLHMEFAPVDFRNVVTETLRPLHKQIEDKHQSLNMLIPEPLPPILADQNRLIQVLTNLVSNAYKYTPPEGEITLRAEVQQTTLDPKGHDLGPSLHISVKDTGIGMSEEDLAKLFTPYFRSENPLTREQPGTGLGLTITRGIVMRHNGNIWLESKLNEGTIFHFTVPLAPQEESLLEPDDDTTQPIRLR